MHINVARAIGKNKKQERKREREVRYLMNSLSSINLLAAGVVDISITQEAQNI